MRILPCLAVTCAVVQAYLGALAAEPAEIGWGGFRNGGTSYASGELPQQWGALKIAWQHELIGYGQSTPVIYGDRVFVTSVAGPMKEECVVSCFDLKTGRELWISRHAASVKGASNYMAARAAPTPVVDGRALYAFFESGDCLAFDPSGKLMWNRSLTADYGRFENNHGLGASPAQTEALVIINVEHKGPSYLLALDKTSGATTWRVDRNSSTSWSSPIVTEEDGQPQIIVSSGGTVDGYAASTGRSLWSIGGLDGNSVPSPTIAGNLLYVGARVREFGSDGAAAKSNLCIALSGSESSSTGPRVTWRASKAISDYASPVVSGEFVYYLNKVGVLYCLSKSTGDTHYVERLGTQCWATPIVAGDRIYFFGKDGKTQVVRSGPEFDLIGSNLLWDSESAPKPQSYVEHSEPASGQAENAESGPRSAGGGPAGQGGMLATLLKADVNADGVLSESEIPVDFKPMLARIDTNANGSLDPTEIKTMADSFAARRSDSRDSARDPIVYGAAAVDGAIVIRTGTRLYCIQ